MQGNKPKVSRVPRSKEEVKATYDRLSKWYDLLIDPFEKQFRRKGLQKLNVQEGEKVLEIGFGTGKCILPLACSVGDSGGVYGIDISKKMYDITKSRVKKAGLWERVKLQCGDALKLPYEKNSLSAIFISFTLELFDTPEIPILLGECQRVLSNQGRICVVGLSAKGKSSLMKQFYKWLHQKFPAYFDCRPIYIQKALESVGFQIMETTQMSAWGLPMEIVLAKIYLR